MMERSYSTRDQHSIGGSSSSVGSSFRTATSPSSSSSSPSSSSSSRVVAIECVRGTSRADEWSGDLLQTGDIVEEIHVSGGPALARPFKDGKAGLQKHLHGCFRSKLTSVRVKVRRGESEYKELNACIVPQQGRKKHQYFLRAIDDPNYAVSFFDRTESQCLLLQASRESRLHHALTSAQLQDGYVSYPWKRKTQELLQVPNSSSFFSILFLPKASANGSGPYDDVEDTLARAHAWLNASQASGVPLALTNIQTESLLTKISGEMASSTVSASSLSDLSNLANASLYGFEDYHGVDIGVVRSVRLWYSPVQGELPLEIDIQDEDVKLGFAISRTEEGFIYISSVLGGDENDVPATRSGLSRLYRDATSDDKLLVVSRVNKHKVLPWIVSTSGAVRCFDTVSLSQKLSLHRHARVPVLLHLLLWDRSLSSPSVSTTGHSGGPAKLVMPSSSAEVVGLLAHSNGKDSASIIEADEFASGDDDELEIGFARDTAGEESFRFHHFTLPDTWV